MKKLTKKILLLSLLGIFASLAWFVWNLFNEEPPTFFPLNNPQGVYTVTKKCPQGQGWEEKPNIQGEAYCIEYKGPDVFMNEKNGNKNFFAITVGKSKVDLEPLNGKQVKNIRGKFVNSSKQCIQNNCININGPFVVLNIDSLEVAPPQKKSFSVHTPHKIAKKDYYTIVMVGDSMTAALGPHGGILSEDLNKLYKSTPGHQKIIIDNYAMGGQNILTLHDTLGSLSQKKFDLILIESYGYNPLSQFPMEEGLKKNKEALDEAMTTLINEHPDAEIIFVATIAPHKQTYAQEVSPNKTTAERVAQAEERITYIKKHLEYAKSHNILFIDVFSKSLTADGNGNLVYINPSDHIHPSFAGVDFISHEIANYIFTNQILQP